MNLSRIKSFVIGLLVVLPSIILMLVSVDAALVVGTDVFVFSAIQAVAIILYMARQ